MNLTQKIEETNALFQTLTHAQQRVAIAKDVLAQLRRRKFIARADTYLPDSLRGTTQEELLSEAIRLDSCSVCALGAVFLSALGLSKLSCVSTYSENCGPSDMIPALSPYFSKQELDEIENAFMGVVMRGDSSGVDFFPRPRRMGFSDTKRLQIIMKNIIRNNGTFDLSQKPELER